MKVLSPIMYCTAILDSPVLYTIVVSYNISPDKITGLLAIV